jgi:AcrR family transcriptional regulator
MRPASEVVIATPQRIEQAALELFFERGYPATTMREIALACGLTAGALYNHFPSKEKLLASIIGRVHDELEKMVTDALASAGDDPRERLRALTYAQALFHTNHTKDARVGNREINWLPEPERTQIVEARRRMRGWFEQEILRGQQMGLFSGPDAKATVKALLYAGIGIADWFEPGGRLSAEQVAEIHGALALRMAGAAP